MANGSDAESGLVIPIKEEITYYCYHWNIPFGCLCSKCLKKKDFISPNFSANTILTDYSYLRLKTFSNETTSLELWAHSINFDNCNLRISVKDRRKKVHFTTEYKEIQLMLNGKSRWSAKYFSNLKFINKISFINDCDFITDGMLTLVVEIIKPVIAVSMNTRHATNIEVDLINLQENEELSDVTLVVGEQEFHAHKAILAARSSVFLAMFKHDMKETIESKVVIEDVSEETMQQVLDYIYSGTVKRENFEDPAVISEVLVIADKYCLEELINICENVLISLLNTDNVLKFLALTEIYKLDFLKIKAINFIAENVKEVSETEEFKKLLDPSKLSLMKEIVLAISNN